MNSPLLSVVIANYNYGCFLETAIKSIQDQNMGDKVEVIICDASSTDNSVEIIKKCANGLPPNTSLYDWQPDNSQLMINDYRLSTKITWWCSEKDGGQSAAFNKGFSHARGRFLTWLNADDVLLPGALIRLEKAVMDSPQCEWFGGGCLFLDKQLKVFKCGRGRKISGLRMRRGVVGVTGPSSFFSADLYHRVGRIDERFHYTMDTDLWLRFAIVAKVSYIPFARYVWGLRLHANAKMSGHKFTEDGRILEGKASREAFLKNKQRLEQIQAEHAWTNEHVGIKKRSMSFVERIISANPLPAIMSRLDTWRYRGHSYQDLFR